MCLRQVLSQAIELQILRPEEVVVVIPPERVHRRNLERRGEAPEEVSTDRRRALKDLYII